MPAPVGAGASSDVAVDDAERPAPAADAVPTADAVPADAPVPAAAPRSGPQPTSAEHAHAPVAEGTTDTAGTPESTTESEPPARGSTASTLTPIAGPSGSPTVSVAPLRVADDPIADGARTADDVAPDGESAETDLDRFFAALRQVVHDARERVVLDGDREDLAPPTSGSSTPTAPPRASTRTSGTASHGTVVPTRPDPVNGTVAAPELAPSTSELISSLQADRDLWRERAVVWRERAMGADMLVKTLNAHMSDLQVNLEDLRLAMRVLSKDAIAGSGPRAELPAPSPRWSGLDRYLEPGA
jgi:hypothetical protein